MRSEGFLIVEIKDGEPMTDLVRTCLLEIKPGTSRMVCWLLYMADTVMATGDLAEAASPDTGAVCITIVRFNDIVDKLKKQTRA